MKRRGFFTALAGAAAGGVAGAAVTPKVELDPLILPNEIQYNGFNIKWTGWKEMPQFLEKAGQWVARPIDGKPLINANHPWGCEGVVSSFPGGVGYFHTGDHFDTCFREEQRSLVGYTDWYDRDSELLVKAQRMALAEIKKFINENC